MVVVKGVCVQLQWWCSGCGEGSVWLRWWHSGCGEGCVCGCDGGAVVVKGVCAATMVAQWLW